MGMNSALAPLAPLERWIYYTQAEIVNLRSDLIQHQQNEIVNLRNDLIKYHQQFAAYQKICQSQLDVLTQQVRQSQQTFTEMQRSIIDLQNTQTEFARNIEDIYRKLISLSSQFHGRSPPETQTIPPPPGGGTNLSEDAPTHTSPCPAVTMVLASVTTLVKMVALIKPLHRSQHLRIHTALPCNAPRWMMQSMDLVRPPEH